MKRQQTMMTQDNKGTESTNKQETHLPSQKFLKPKKKGSKVLQKQSNVGKQNQQQ